ncbi:Phosphatidylethanolamine binding protein [Phaffia rhodozyma]|uniref:Phosphatidylethanolamine binding protein n=1 Tax=Phaffia rhodozyma TaxID=264483 RepID=A0A0F7SSZ6_PHARH|nr:Phosphatidylethanolamine binding protein [Phaffia rhodozyma]
MHRTCRSLGALSTRATVQVRSSNLIVSSSRSFHSSYTRSQETASASASSSWTPPVTPGRNKNYDAALAYIQSSMENMNKKLEELKPRIEQLREKVEASKKAAENGKELDFAAFDDLARLELEKERIENLGEFHNPKTRWESENGLLDPTTPVARYLARERFELKGSLDAHTNALNEMYVIPDLIGPPSKGLRVDIALRYPVSAPPPPPKPDQFGYVKKVRKVETRDPKDGNRVIVGRMLPVEETLKEPELEIRYFGEKDTFGTLFMIDLDVPDVENHTFKSQLHWLVPNIPLSAKSQVFPSSDPSVVGSSSAFKSQLPPAVVPYLAPHPHKGTPYHRYVFVLVQHDEPVIFGPKAGKGVIKTPKRENFKLRTFLRVNWKMQDIVGMSFIREIYDSKVCPKIWKDIIQQPEVKYFVGQPQSMFWTPEKKNRAEVYNQKLGIVSSGPDLNQRFVRTPGWEGEFKRLEDSVDSNGNPVVVVDRVPNEVTGTKA